MKIRNMPKILFIFLILSISVLSMACTSNEQEDKLGAYLTAIDKLYEEDSALNSDIKYLAIDTSNIAKLSDVDIESLLKSLEDYGFEVLNMTMDELMENGYISELYFEEGILFRIEDQPFKNNSVSMNISKWRSGLGAVGYDGLTLKYKDGVWTIEKFESAWMS